MDASLPLIAMNVRNLALAVSVLAALGLGIARLGEMYRQLFAASLGGFGLALLMAPLSAIVGKLDWAAVWPMEARLLILGGLAGGVFLLNLLLFERLPEQRGMLRLGSCLCFSIFVIVSLLSQPLTVNASNMLLIGVCGGIVASIQLSLHRFSEHRKLLGLLALIGFTAFFWGMLLLSPPPLRLQNFFFWLFTAGVIGGGIGCVTMRNVFHSALMLILSLFGVAGFFILLNAEFLAMVQVIIYIGGIMVLFLFGIMVSQNIIGTELRQNTSLSPWAAALCTLLFMFMAFTGLFMTVPQNLDYPQGAAVLASNTQAIGWSLMATYTLPFEAASVLLLMSMLGAIILVRKD